MNIQEFLSTTTKNLETHLFLSLVADAACHTDKDVNRSTDVDHGTERLDTDRSQLTRVLHNLLQETHHLKENRSTSEERLYATSDHKNGSVRNCCSSEGRLYATSDQKKTKRLSLKLLLE